MGKLGAGLGALLAAVLVVGCGESDSGFVPPTPAPTPTATPVSVTVHPGESIQAAIDAAAPNTTIYVEPGTYHDAATTASAITVSKDGIHLIGLSTPGNPVTLENSGNQMYGIWVSPADSIDVVDHEHPPCGTMNEFVRGFTLQGFTLKEFDQFGVYLGCNDGYTLTQLVSDGNQVYGIFPVRSVNGVVSNNQALNTPLDAAIYVGQSSNIAITGNVAHDSLIGIEIENSSNVTETQNEVYNDTVGLLADVLPGLQKPDQANVVMSNNNVHDNNRANSAEPGDITAAIPSGTGILVLAGTTTTVQNNIVSNNGFAGVVVASYCTGATLLGQSCGMLDIDPNPENVQVLDNQLTNNGTNPPSNFVFSSLAGDLIWDKTGMGNCWAGNTAGATTRVLGGGHLPACQ